MLSNKIGIALTSSLTNFGKSVLLKQEAISLFKYTKRGLIGIGYPPRDGIRF